MNADGSEPIMLTDFSHDVTPSNVSVSKPTWSPTGDRIAFHRRVGLQDARGHLEIYIVGLHDGLPPTRVTFTTPTPGLSGFPAWGKWAVRQ